MPTRWGVLAVSLALTVAACGAKRDPDLETRAIKAAVRPDEPAIVDSSPPPPAGGIATEEPEDKGSDRPIKRYSQAEIATILGRVGGASGPLTATFATAVGTFSCELFESEAPETVANFVGLATGALPWTARAGGRTETGPYFDSLTFHRAIDAFMIQSGKRSPHFAGGPGWRLARETARNDAFDAPGALAMADDGDATHGSQYFITLKQDKSLSKRFAAFGVCTGLDIVRAIAAGEKRPAASGSSASSPVAPVKLERVTISRGAAGLN